MSGNFCKCGMLNCSCDRNQIDDDYGLGHIAPPLYNPMPNPLMPFNPPPGIMRPPPGMPGGPPLPPGF